MTRGPELHYFRCNRVCKSVTVVAFKTSNYERCRACGSNALYQFSVPVETDEQRALHARGSVCNPHKPEPVQWSCVRCGEDKTGTLSTLRADGKVCRDCYKAEMAPEWEAEGERVAAIARELQAERDAKEAARLERIQELLTKGQG